MSRKDSISARKVWSNSLFAFRTLFGPTPLFGISIIVEAIRHNLINFLEQTICVYTVLRAVEYSTGLWSALRMIIIFIGVDILAACISSFYEQKIRIKYLPKAQYALKSKLYEKAGGVSIKNYDDPAYYDEYCLVIAEADKAIERAEQLLRKIFGGLTLLICYGAFFLTQDVFSIVFIFVAFVLRVTFSNALNKLLYKLRNLQVPFEKKREYIKRLFYLKDYAKEIRLNGKVTKNFHKEFDEAEDNLIDLQKRFAKKDFALSFTSGYLFSEFLLDIVYILYLIIRAAVRQSISFSQIVVLYKSSENLRMGFATLAEIGPYAVETSMYIEKIRNFLNSEVEDRESKTREIPKTAAKLECRNVSFSYDKQNKILDNINIIIEPGEKVALVGHNGTGKSTLVKLLLRLYEPDEGEILLDGVNIKEYSLKEYREYIGAVFQDFQLYATSIKENIVMDRGETTSDQDVLDAAEKSGFAGKMEKLPRGMNTELTTEFSEEGTDLSGGEGQKVSVARGFLKDQGLMILDEPSSALDPIAEYELNCSMYNAARNRSVVFISHRLSTTRGVDKIYVMEKGQIAEVGNHEELLKLDGIYKKMWNAQALRYA